MFRALCAHHQEVKIVLYTIWYHQTETSEWYHVLIFIELYFNNFRPLTCFGVMITDAPDDEHIVLETCRYV